MKRVALVIAALALCGCGDDIEKNYYTTTTAPDWGFPNISTAVPPETTPPPATDPVAPPVVAGAMPWIPSNTVCTSAMNAAFALYSSPERISTSEDNDGWNSVSWNYPAKELYIYFTWGSYVDSGVCDQTTSTYLTP